MTRPYSYWSLPYVDRMRINASARRLSGSENVLQRYRTALEKIAKDGSCPNGDIHLQTLAREALNS